MNAIIMKRIFMISNHQSCQLTHSSSPAAISRTSPLISGVGSSSHLHTSATFIRSQSTSNKSPRILDPLERTALRFRTSSNKVRKLDWHDKISLCSIKLVRMNHRWHIPRLARIQERGIKLGKAAAGFTSPVQTKVEQKRMDREQNMEDNIAGKNQEWEEKTQRSSKARLPGNDDKNSNDTESSSSSGKKRLISPATRKLLIFGMVYFVCVSLIVDFMAPEFRTQNPSAMKRVGRERGELPMYDKQFGKDHRVLLDDE